MNKFKAKSELNLQKSSYPVVQSGKNNLEIKAIPKDDSEVWDFTKITIQKLGKELESTINSKTPMFLWSKERQNNKIRLDNEKQLFIYEKIKNLRAIASEFSQLQADAIFSEQFIKNLVAEKILLAEQYFERIKEVHLTAILAEQAKRKHIGHELTEREIAQRKEEAIIRKLNGEADQAEAKAAEMRAIAKQAEVRADLMKIATGEVKFSELPKSSQTFILINILDADPNHLSDFDIKEQMKDIIIQQGKAEADIKTAEADSAKTKNATEEWKFDRDKKSVEKNDPR